MKLSTTQTRLLRDAATHPHGFVITSVALGTGPMGGRIATGMRALNAARALRDAGLFTRDTSTVSTFARNGHGVRVRDTVWTITNAGRALAATLETP